MKIINLMIVIIVAIAIISCQKQLGSNANGTSSGSLNAAITGDCFPSTLYGNYRVDSSLTSDNYIDVQVNATIDGTFSINTDTVNGYWFSKTGNVSLGLNTVRLYASGKPLATGNNTFTIKYGSSVCTFNVTVFPAAGAIYTLSGSPGTCSGAVLTGSYTNGIAMTTNNTASIVVDVLIPGNYLITTPVVNGLSFAASGTFVNPGYQNIVLIANGTAIAAGIYNYPVIFNTNTCSFSVTVN